MARLSLQPIRRFAVIAVAAHVALGSLLWWAFKHNRSEPAPATASAPPAELTWVSPGDFSPGATAPPPAPKPKVSNEPLRVPILSAPTPQPLAISPTPPPSKPMVVEPSPAPLPKPAPKFEPPAPEKPITALAGSPTPAPAPKPDSEANRRSMLAVVGTELPKAAPPPAPVAPPKKVLPKAIAIDPKQALALMKAQEAAEKPKPVPVAVVEPKKSASPPAETAFVGPPKPDEQPKPVEAPKKPEVAAFVGPPKPVDLPKPAEAPKVALAKPPAPPTPKPEPAPAEESPPSSDFLRFITVSKRNASQTKAGASSAPEKGISFEAVDNAIRSALLRTWNPPDPNTLPFNQRTAEVNMSIDRVGHVQTFTLVKRSGNEDFDQSVRLAGHRLEKVQSALPAAYPHDSYEFQLHFHVE